MQTVRAVRLAGLTAVIPGFRSSVRADRHKDRNNAGFSSEWPRGAV